MDDLGPMPVEMAHGEWAIVEILGHRTLIGRIAEVERFGTKMLQVEPLFDGQLLEPVFHGGTSIYAMTPCTAEVAWKRQARRRFDLPAAISARLPPPALPAPAPAPHFELESDEVD